MPRGRPKKGTTTTKKKTVAKKTKTISQVKKILAEETSAPEEETPQETLTETMSEETKELRRYKFIATCNNLNISNVIFNNIKVIIYQINTTSFEIAFNEFQKVILKMFDGDVVKYNTFMHSVFGDTITVESTPLEYVKEQIATLS